VATALVLALTLVLDGVDRSFPNEARRTVDAFDAGAWLVPEGASGVFMSSTVLPAETASTVAALPDVGSAAPVAVLRATLGDGTDVNVIGVVTGTIADPPVVEGRVPSTVGEATVERSLGIEVGEAVTVAGAPLTVVGITSGLSFRAGVPSLYMNLGDAQAIGYRGAPLASAVVTERRPASLPPGIVALDDAEVRTDLLAPIVNARKTIGLVLALLRIVAAMVIGSVVYLTSLDRTRDFAVLKATGATNAGLLSSLALQSAILSVGASVLAVAMSALLAPALPMRTEIAPASYLTLAVVAVGVAVIASLVSARRTLRIDPALAFSGA
jgi:putative ABC transport system permease protein